MGIERGLLGFDPAFVTLFILVFVASIGLTAVMVVKYISLWHRNNRAPRLTVEAEVVAKEETHRRHISKDDPMTMFGRSGGAAICYYVTFRTNRGDRIEFLITGREYDGLAEGERGMLTYQGTRYLGFAQK